MKFLFDAKTTKELSSVAFGIPTVHFGKFFFQFSGTDTIFFGEILFQVDSIFFFFHLPKVFVTHHHGVEHSELVVSKVVLFEHRKAFARTERDLTASRVEFATEHTDEGRFTSTVCTDYTIAVACCEFKVDIREKHSFAELHC